jgi:isocitrate dehydrogenase kinase/phosphatase
VAQEVIDEMVQLAPSVFEEAGPDIVLRHVYIERRMRPLNIHLRQAGDAELERSIEDYGNAIRELASANIFPGDMLYKNFGITRLERVVFYDYDEIQYMTEMNFRDMPQPRTEEEEMADTPWYAVGKNDVFPEEFEIFLLGDPRVRAAFKKHHAALLTAQWWRDTQKKIQAGHIQDAFPYRASARFAVRFARP